jgi:hypothetical protein
MLRVLLAALLAAGGASQHHWLGFVPVPYSFGLSVSPHYHLRLPPLPYAVVGGDAPKKAVAGSALSFDGFRDYVLVPVKPNDVTDIHGSSAFTIEAWVKPRKGGKGGCVLSKSNEEVSSEYAVNVGEGGIVGFHRETESPNTFSTRRVRFGEWTHIAVSYDGTEARIFLNGTHAGKKRQGAIVAPLKKVPLMIGALYFKGKPSGFFGGVIDDVRIWNVARTNVEIFRDMNRTLAGSTTGLVADWKFDEGTNAFAKDSVSMAAGTDGPTGRLGDGILEDRPLWIQSNSPQGRGKCWNAKRRARPSGDHNPPSQSHLNVYRVSHIFRPPSRPTFCSVCPNFCSGHGKCHHHVCECEMGWKAADCNSRESSGVTQWRDSRHRCF